MSVVLSSLLTPLPKTLKEELLQALNQIDRNFKESRWEPAELNGGKLCEVVYSILKGYIDNNYPKAASKPKNMLDACRKLEQSSNLCPRSVRIQIPRILIALYEMRNNRGVGHVGGDVDPNHMDAVCVLQMSKWIVAELIRVFHDITTQEASDAVEALSSRELPLIWKVDGISRVLDINLSMLNKTLVLLYGQPSGINEKELVTSLEHSNPSIYRRDVLRAAHKRRLIEYNATMKKATISPLGIKHVESHILV